MKKKKPRPKITLGKLYRGAREPEKSYHELFASIAELYAEFRERLDSGAINTSNPDPIGPRPLRSDLAVNWMVDTEHAIESACKNEGMEAAAIALLREAAGLGKADIGNNLKHKTIQAIGRQIERRGLTPKSYFRAVKRKKEK